MIRLVKIILLVSLFVGFITISQSCMKLTAPVITTLSVSGITQTSSICGGNVTDDGGTEVTDRGVCWSTLQNPTTNSSKTNDGIGTGTFTSSITGLAPGTKYFIRAYATNREGTSYGNEVTFSSNPIVLATLTTTEVSSKTSSSAISGGNITNDGGGKINERGICWSKSQNPTTSDSKTTNGSGTGSFVSQLTGLTENTKYYIRAYAINSSGQAYGNEVTCITSQNLPPTIITTETRPISSTTAISGGNIIDDGGNSITGRGVCWNTTGNPTVLDHKTIDGTGEGSFTSNILGLLAATTYYVKAYAINSLGTFYGNELSITTYTGVPTVTTEELSLLTQSTVTSGGTIINNGGLTITVLGVCWGTSENLTLSNTISRTSESTSSVTFTSYVTDLFPNVTYYLRAYATNPAGTGYGNILSFSTVIGPNIFNPNVTYGTLTDVDGNVYKTIIIGTQTWMAENLKTTKFSDGTKIGNAQDRNDWYNLITGMTPGYCWNYNDIRYKDAYGALYNGYATYSGKLCPVGWHVPSPLDMESLINSLGGTSEAGGKLKEIGTTHWIYPNTGANNEVGFTALPGGYREFTGGWEGNNGYINGKYAIFWYSLGINMECRGIRIDYLTDEMLPVATHMNEGHSVRCIKD